VLALNCNQFLFCGGVVDECVLWLSFAQQKYPQKNDVLTEFVMTLVMAAARRLVGKKSCQKKKIVFGKNLSPT
jgi:hypothetical protein